MLDQVHPLFVGCVYGTKIFVHEYLVKRRRVSSCALSWSLNLNVVLTCMLNLEAARNSAELIMGTSLYYPNFVLIQQKYIYEKNKSK